MINIDEVMADLHRYKWSYEQISARVIELEKQVEDWIDLFNAARTVAIQLAYKAGAGVNVDDLITQRRKLKQEETNEKSEASKADHHP